MKKQQKTERTTVRLTPDEKGWLIQQADQNKISISRYIRKVALGEIRQDNRKVKGGTITDQEFLDLFKVIAKIGSNMNQIAKRLHISHAEQKAKGEEDFDLSEYPVEEILKFVKVFEVTQKKLAEMNRLIKEVV